ncbi:LacI family DNA-binding transcriptional regulator [Silvibacterium sp.]|uniref:LacI family DNA-binding transcriptional regulator n=1 Tax=Silvibacterium sp. TaxID=1964179 RepID=UPI0039E5E9E9
MAVRLKDIAADLGVSMVTVSKVLRGKPDVGEETRQRVLKRVEELNYRPNMLARGLASGKSFTVGLIVPDLVHTFFAEFAKGLSKALRQRNYQLILASAEEDPEMEREEIDQLLGRGVDALLIASCQSSTEGFAALIESKRPFLLFDRLLPELDAHFVGTDDLQAGRIATEHLISLGRRQIAHIGGEGMSTAADRLAGYRAALEAHGLPFREELAIKRARLEDVGDQTGRDAMNQLLQLPERPDAVFCYNDLTAVGAIASIRAHGLRVPEDVAVIGCGNLRLAPYLDVPLSSVDQLSALQGERAAQIALAVIAGKAGQVEKEIRMKPQLIARASTVGK